jgi:hypothetical protein
MIPGEGKRFSLEGFDGLDYIGASRVINFIEGKR